MADQKDINQLNGFDDPEFKSAVKRACLGIRATEALRQRATAQAARAAQFDSVNSMESMDSAADHAPLGSIKGIKPTGLQPSTGFGWRNPALRIAAGLLIAFIGTYVILTTRTAAASVPQAILESMIEGHDRCCRAPNHHLPGVTDVAHPDFHVLGAALAARISVSAPVRVLAADLRPDGWEFSGGAICHIKDHPNQPTAHLLFKSSHGRLSVYTLPPSLAAGSKDGTIAGLMVNGHPTAVQVDRSGAVYALVYDGSSLNKQHMQSLLQKHSSDFESAARVALKMLREFDQSREMRNARDAHVASLFAPTFTAFANVPTID